MIRQLSIFSLMILFLTSCLKQSIADAMLETQRGNSPKAATMSYEVNGNLVTTTVANPDDQLPTSYDLGCSKTIYPGPNNTIYALDFRSHTGYLTFTLGTDSLHVGNYLYTGYYLELFVLSYNGEDEFVHVPTDSISFNITSYSSGHISGNFSGRLTPMVTAGYPNNSYGTPGSVLITNGIFKDVPVFY